MKKIYLFISAYFFALLTGCVKETRNSSESNQPFQTASNEETIGATNENASTSAGKYVPNEILIKFKEGTSEEAKRQAFGRITASVVKFIHTNAMKRFGVNEGIYLLRTPLIALEAVSRISGVEIEYAEPNYIYLNCATSTDTYFSNGSMWGMYGPGTKPANKFGSNAASAWNAGKTGSSDVYIGVIDQGIQFDHPDLAGQVWTNPFDPPDGLDNDGNGYIDDVKGWDFANGDNSIYDGGPGSTVDYHGTHVTGIIGAKADANGVVGVNWKVTIIPVKFLGEAGGTTATAIQSVDYITDLKIRHNLKLVATNNSWGGAPFSQALLDAITRGAKANILFVAAAGNGGSDLIGDNNDIVGTEFYPATYNTNGHTGGTSPLNPNTNVCEYDAVISVAAIKSDGKLADFSNYGKTTIDIGAPGVDIWSTMVYNQYQSKYGTSMATPYVSGAAALYASVKPGSSAATIKNAILNSAGATPSLRGKCVTNGRLDVNAALSK